MKYAPTMKLFAPSGRDAAALKGGVRTRARKGRAVS